MGHRLETYEPTREEYQADCTDLMVKLGEVLNENPVEVCIPAMCWMLAMVGAELGDTKQEFMAKIYSSIGDAWDLQMPEDADESTIN